MSQDYEDMRYVFFTQKEMDEEKGLIITFRSRTEIGFDLCSEPPPYYVYELVEVVLPKGAGEHGDGKRPIKVTYV